MHTAAKQPSETTSSNPQTAEEALAHIKAVYRVKRLESELTMITAQTKALEALIYCMTPIQNTGDSKLDAFYAKERNRQRLAATQTLLHIRTVQREKRLRQTMRAKAKAKAERLEPNRASDGSQASEKEMPSPPSPLRGRRWSCADSAQDRMRGRSEPSDESIRTCSANPSPQPSPAQSMDRGEGAKPRSRYKTRKPKHPKRPRKRKR
jgi:hypothetical protein